MILGNGAKSWINSVITKANENTLTMLLRSPMLCLRLRKYLLYDTLHTVSGVTQEAQLPLII